jgi:tRNA-dihydrouridine synthase
MIGRGIFHNPWFFNETPDEKTPDEKLEQLWKHTLLFTKTWGRGKNFATLKRFFKIYTSGFPGAHQIRARLMEANSNEDVRMILEEVKRYGKEGSALS